MAKIGDWMKSLSWLANVGHFLGGYAVLLTTLRFTHAHDPLWIVESVFVFAVLFKEYVVDLHFESDEDVASSSIDAMGYFLGHGAAWAVVMLTGGLGP